MFKKKVEPKQRYIDSIGQEFTKGSRVIWQDSTWTIVEVADDAQSVVLALLKGNRRDKTHVLRDASRATLIPKSGQVIRRSMMEFLNDLSSVMDPDRTHRDAEENEDEKEE